MDLEPSSTRKEESLPASGFKIKWKDEGLSTTVMDNWPTRESGDKIN